MSFNITGYHCLQFQTRSDTDDGRGGVWLFINSNFTYGKRDDLSVFIPHVIESVFFEIQINERKTIIVGVVYRPNTQPRADIDIFMPKIIETQSKIKEENKVSYLMGDFNIDLLKVNIHAKTNEFVNDVISQGFLPKITRPTRITPHSATLIDHINSNENRPAGADPGFKKRGWSNIFDVAKYIGVLEVGGGGVACMSTLRNSYREAVILETKIFVI